MSHGPTLPTAQHGGNAILRVIHALSRLCGLIAALMIVASVGITCQMIWIRFVMNGSTIWQTEAVVYLMVAATLIGLPYVQYLRGHVNVDLIPLMLPDAVRRGLAILTLFAAIVVIGVVLYYAFDLWHVAWSRGWTSDTVWGPPLWIPYLAMPIGFGLYLLQLAGDLYAVIVGIERPFGITEEQV